MRANQKIGKEYPTIAMIRVMWSDNLFRRIAETIPPTIPRGIAINIAKIVSSNVAGKY